MPPYGLVWDVRYYTYWFPRIPTRIPAMPCIGGRSEQVYAQRRVPIKGEFIMIRSISTYLRTFALAGLTLCAAFMLPALPANAAAGSDTVRAFYATLLDTMRNAQTLGAQ